MYHTWHHYCPSAILAGLLFFSSTVAALNLETGVGVGMEYTDNVAFTADNEEDDLLGVAYVGAKIDAGSGPTFLNANASLKRQAYAKETFEAKNYLKLNARAGWETFKDRLDWNVSDYFTQRPINSLDPTTPDNTQNTNTFNFGANVYFPISGRQSVTVSPSYRKFDYEIQNFDNQNNTLDARWNYQLYRTLNVGLRGSIKQVDYDEVLISDNTFTSAYLTLAGSRPSSTYSMDLGSTLVDRENSSGQRGFSGNLNWLYNVTGHSGFRTFLSTGLTDSSNALNVSSTIPGGGDFQNVQISADVFRDSIIRLSYLRSDATLQTSVWTELRQLDYEVSLRDRDVQELGLRFNYPVTAVVSTGISTVYNNTVLPDVNREDDRYILSGNINYRISRKLSARVDIKFQNRDSNLDTADYREASIFAGLSYGYGQVPRATRSGGGL